jgi:PAS domain S-box-containing protein
MNEVNTVSSAADTECETNFSKAFHSSSIMKFILDYETLKFVDVNHTWLETMGYEREEVVGRTATELDVYENIGVRKELVRAVQQRQAISNQEIRTRTKCGQILTTITGIDYIYYKGKLCILGETVDITGHKHTELALLQSEEKFYKAFNSSFIIQIISRLQDGLIIEANDACCAAFAMSRSDMIGKTSNEMGMWVSADQRPRIIEHLLQDGYYYNPDWKYKIGSQIKCGIVNLKMIKLAGEWYILTSLVDITERKLAEQALVESEERFYNAFHNSPVIMAIYDAESIQHIEINQRYTAVFGYTPEEAVGKTPGELDLWKDFMQKQSFISALQVNERVENFEAQLVTKHGVVRTVLLQVQTIHLNGIRCFLNSMIDITALKNMEQEINRLDRLHLVGEMAASLGHEIRNPMTSVRGFLQLLGEKDDLAHYKDYFNLMIEEMDRANEIVTSFLSMSTNKLISPQLEDLNQTISSIFPLIQADATRADKVVELDLEPLPRLMIDLNEIRQMIINLARNGLESMPGRGTLVIGSRCQGSQAVLFVRDQGTGLDPAVINKIGTPFTTTKENGIGIGLAVCYSIAARHKAEIEFETSPKGTTFYVKFNIS